MESLSNRLSDMVEEITKPVGERVANVLERRQGGLPHRRRRLRGLESSSGSARVLPGKTGHVSFALSQTVMT